MLPKCGRLSSGREAGTSECEGCCIEVEEGDKSNSHHDVARTLPNGRHFPSADVGVHGFYKQLQS